LGVGDRVHDGVEVRVNPVFHGSEVVFVKHDDLGVACADLCVI